MSSTPSAGDAARFARARAHRLAGGVGALPTPAATKLRNLKLALRRWVGSGCALAPSRERKIRSAICSACPHWYGLGNLGLGECRAPGCGCTRAKVWLATERCPIGKWRANAAVSSS